MLGPGVNLARVPWGGRLYEYLGEDPALASALVFAMVTGIQKNNVSACVKHYLGNNQEFSRNNMDALISEREDPRCMTLTLTLPAGLVL